MSKLKAATIKARFDEIFENRTDQEKLKLDAYVLMASFLSEIETVLEQEKMSKKILAQKIGTSPSYLTQVFRGDKPLNFSTLAKIQNALHIHFETRVFKNESIHNSGYKKIEFKKGRKELVNH